MTENAANPPDLAVLHEAYCLPSLCAESFSPQALWSLLEAITEESPDIEIEEIGRSAEGVPLRSLSFGTGPARVLLWSGPHPEGTAHTIGLADLFAYWRREPEDPRVTKLRNALTVVAVPLLDPEAEGGAVLRALYDRVCPHFVLGPALADDPAPREALRRDSFVATLSALEAIAEGSYAARTLSAVPQGSCETASPPSRATV